MIYRQRSTATQKATEKTLESVKTRSRRYFYVRRKWRFFWEVYEK